MSSQILLEVKNVSKSYENGNVVAVDNVSFTVADGEFVIITGPSGSGKSTILHLLGGLDTPTQGEIYYESKPMRELSTLPLFRIKNIGFVFQEFYLWPNLDVFENISLPLMEISISKGEMRHRAESLASLVGIKNKLSTAVRKLSSGEKQRVAIARALVTKPSVLLADEPTANLDIKNRDSVLKVFKAINTQKQMTIIMATHDQRIFDYSDKILTLCDGKLTPTSL
jgi:putative ABC transport system ATP-binding protein